MNSTTTGPSVGEDRLSVNTISVTPLSPSTTLASATLSVGKSLIAPTACPPPTSGTPLALDSVTKNSSSPSNSPSASIGTSICFSVSPAANTSVPATAV